MGKLEQSFSQRSPKAADVNKDPLNSRIATRVATDIVKTLDAGVDSLTGEPAETLTLYGHTARVDPLLSPVKDPGVHHHNANKQKACRPLYERPYKRFFEAIADPQRA
ncbi:hypothetical protein Ddc_15379 [Ditylenchus destructor]|nr:hypothetical protein Ddc_15379 [Ditylenchus destructor]